MTDPARSRCRLPHWGWFLLGTVTLVIAGLGLSIWLPYYHEQKAIRKIGGWGGLVNSETAGPEWLRWLVGEGVMRKLKVFDRAFYVNLGGTKVTDGQVADLARLTNLRVLHLRGTAVTRATLIRLVGLRHLEFLSLGGSAVTAEEIEEFRKALPHCDIKL